jgi:hypothetical protein
MPRYFRCLLPRTIRHGHCNSQVYRPGPRCPRRPWRPRMSWTQSLVQVGNGSRACMAAGSKSGQDHGGSAGAGGTGAGAESIATGATQSPKPRRRGPEICCSSARQCPNCPRRNAQS